jgi:uncharacterized short protein YbdD (DUF466 family)
MKRWSALTYRLLTWRRRTWKVVRTLSGDDAYERYLEHFRERHPDARPVDRSEFYVREQERRYSGGPTGCC